ncbi:FG-GAP-like repeat-containing protein [Hyphobacterium sp. SN044]|uniref:Ig-like domain-containing protein n=1 Tax=Hyphobacterium sp. SN044 TaxID=2912575 RepID=UPI001F456D0F|nr:Ig-like domain-containing protein [Hyphobacterium sp. SN044]MCF8878876.1 FG-GAP-like repeat-containing protein [Hyphobacterium sp. SN044]
MMRLYVASVLTLLGSAVLTGPAAALDPPVAQDDHFEMTEQQPLSGNLFVDNGNGPDTDPDGDEFHVRSVRHVRSEQIDEPIDIQLTRIPDNTSGPFESYVSFDAHPNGDFDLYQHPSSNLLSAGVRVYGRFQYYVSEMPIADSITAPFGSNVDFGYNVQGVHELGDVNGDGRDDIAVRYQEPIYRSSPQSRTAVIFNNGRFDAAEDFDFASLNGSNGFRIFAPGSGEFRVFSVGDLDDDGHADIFVQRQAESRIRYGASSNPSDWSLTDSAAPGAIFAIVDSAPGGQPGAPAAGAGDINGDGFNDLAVVTRRTRDDNTTTMVLVIVYGTGSRWIGELDLAEIDGTNGALIDLESTASAWPIFWLDDFNGDGRSDLYFARSQEDIPDGREGAVYVLFGQPTDLPGNMTPSYFDGSGGMRIVGGGRTYAVGYFALPAGDMNGDGLSDIAFSNYIRSPYEPVRFNVVFGSDTPQASGSVVVSDAVTAGGFTFWIQDGYVNWPLINADIATDINGDGYDDFLVSMNRDIEEEPTDIVMAIMGRDDWSGTYELAELPAASTLAFFGSPRPGEESCSVSQTTPIGDVDSDGFQDFVTSGTWSTDASRACVLYGGIENFGRPLDLSVQEAEVFITLTGENSPPVASDVVLSTHEDAIVQGSVFSVTADPDRDDRVFVSAIDNVRSRVDRWYELPAGGRLQVTSSGAIIFDPDGDFQSLRVGERSEQAVSFTITSTDGFSDQGTLTLTVSGRDGIDLRPDLFVASPQSNLNGNFFADNGNGSDTADDTLVLTGMVLDGRARSPGTPYLLQSGSTIQFETNGSFQYTPSPQQAMPGAVAETFTYSARAANASSQTTASFAVRGISDTRHTISLTVSGPAGAVARVREPELRCYGDCTFEVFAGTSIRISADTYRANDGFYASLSDWGGRCDGVVIQNCQFIANASHAVSAQFNYTLYGPTSIYSATLPGARSGVVGGSPITVFASVANANRNTAYGCSFGSNYEPQFSYQETDAANNAVGDANPYFDIAPGASRSFVLAYSPRVAFSPRAFYPSVVCGNGVEAAPAPGVNSIFLSASETPTPDILSIAATPSGDGVIRILTPGGRRFMSAAAVNIGAGDAAPDGVDGALANEATITVTADTGATVLPLDVTVCETGSDGRCLEPAGTEVVTQIGDSAKTFAVFVQASSDAGIAFDPANSRVYLRFRDAGGVVRSVTSAAVIAPAPANDFEGAEGFWSLGIVGRDETGAPAHSSAWLLAHSDGRASLIRGEDVTTLRWQIVGNAVRFMDADGALVMEGRLEESLSLRLLSASGERINGVHSGLMRPALDLSEGHYVLSGSVARTLTVSESGEIRFAGSGCVVSAAPANDRIEASVSGCDQAGRGEMIVFDHADAETGEIARSLAIITDAGGFRGRVEVAQ